MVEIEMRFKGLVLVDTWEALQIFRVEYLKGFKKSLETLRDMVRERTPKGASLRLYHSIIYVAKDLTPTSPFGFPTAPPEFEGKVYSRSEREVTWGIFATPYFSVCKYAAPVEYGTKPHFPPVFGPESIHSWAGHVLPMMPKLELAQTAWKIALHISKHGTRARYMFRDARQAFISQGIFEKNIKEAADIATIKATAETPWWAAF